MKGLRYNESIAAAFESGARVPYDQKHHGAVFRGSCNSASRENIAKLAKSHPGILNITCNGPSSLALLEYGGWKVTTNILGNGWSCRTKWLMALGSPMIFLNGGERKSTMDEVWYPLMRPYVHYWPITSEHQLLPAVTYLLEHPQEAKAIADAGGQFVREWLNVDEIDCLWLYYAHYLSSVSDGQGVHVPRGAKEFTNVPYGQIVRTFFRSTWETP